MKPILQSIARVRLIAANTFLEAVRQKLFNVLVILALALVLSAQFFGQFDFGDSQLKFMADFGFGAILFFGSLIAVVATAQLFFSEMDNRTALTVLARPVHKGEFLAGKYCGAAFVLAIYTLVMTVLLTGVLYLAEMQIEMEHPEIFVHGRIVPYGSVLVFGIVQWLKFAVLAAVTLLVASFANTNLYAVVVSFFIMVICQLQYIAMDRWEDVAFAPARWAVRILGLIFPNFQVYNIGDILLTGTEPFEVGLFVRIVIYSLVYIAVFNALAVYSFRNREI